MNFKKFLIFTMCFGLSLLSISVAKSCSYLSLLHRSRTLCWRIAAGTTSFSVLIRSWDSSTRRPCLTVRPKARTCWRFSQWTVRSLQGLANMDNPTLVREAGQISTKVQVVVLQRTFISKSSSKAVIESVFSSFFFFTFY